MNNIDNRTLAPYKGYTALVEFSAEDGCLIGRIVGIQDIIVFHGVSVAEIEDEFHAMVDSYIDNCSELGKEPEQPKTTLQVPVSSALYAALASQAKHTGTSVDDYVQQVLTKVVYTRAHA